MIESIFLHPWVWIVPIVLIIGLLLLLADMFIWQEGIAAVCGAIILLVGGGLYFGVMLPPYDISYYQTYRMTGEVTEIEAAFSGDEGSMSQVFVAHIDGVDEFIKSDDQRFRTIEVGDEANLVCVKVFKYFQEPYYDCSFGG